MNSNYDEDVCRLKQRRRGRSRLPWCRGAQRSTPSLAYCCHGNRKPNCSWARGRERERERWRRGRREKTERRRGEVLERRGIRQRRERGKLGRKRGAEENS